MSFPRSFQGKTKNISMFFTLENVALSSVWQEKKWDDDVSLTLHPQK